MIMASDNVVGVIKLKNLKLAFDYDVHIIFEDENTFISGLDYLNSGEHLRYIICHTNGVEILTE